jgi:hypothetical protein
VKRAERQLVFEKYGGKCAYCGCGLEKGWHVDHVEPYWHNWSEDNLKRMVKVVKGSNGIDNYNPSCPRCNKWKSTFSIEQFREEIQLQTQRLRNFSSNYRMAIDYRMIEETNKPVVFYFELLNSDKNVQECDTTTEK